MGKTSISWCDSVWNPTTGCSKIAAGCLNCYAARMAKRLAGRCGYPADDPFKVTLHPDRLDEPLHWRKPRRVFVNSMSDLFHGKVPWEFVDQVFGVMALCQQHTFLVLTKRPAEATHYFMDHATRHKWGAAARAFVDKPNIVGVLGDQGCNPDVCNCEYPLPNLWLGFSASTQRDLDAGLPHLLKCPTKVRFLSLEPLVEALSISQALGIAIARSDTPDDRPAVDWVVVGGESGPGARPCSIEWIRSIVGQCKAAGVPCFVKQLGPYPIWQAAGGDVSHPNYNALGWRDNERRIAHHAGHLHLRDRKGSDPSEWPEDLRVRESP